MSSRSIARITAATLAATAALGVAALPASAQSTPHHAAAYRTGVVISDVQYDSPGFDDRSNRSLNREWIEVTNTFRRSVNLDGWTLSDEDGHTYTFDHYRLAGRSTVRVHTGYGRDTYRDVYQDRRNYVWDNYSDTATLRNDDGRLVDEVSWGDNDRDGRRWGSDRDGWRWGNHGHHHRHDGERWGDRHNGEHRNGQGQGSRH
ncbi:lamin tail domain-containing protein (plasmid) [Streptomyces sp. AHU1]|uniref:lamin tail domain-containing protein n=1 Tax=Streptomyces sp. AHU1 TaxID=3377215 RepID=UPI003878369A